MEIHKQCSGAYGALLDHTEFGFDPVSYCYEVCRTTRPAPCATARFFCGQDEEYGKGRR